MAQSTVRLHASGIKKSYSIGSESVEVLRGVNFEIGESESVAIMGQSGSGKTTLLQILGVMTKPDHGSLAILGQDVASFDDSTLSRFRRQELGFVFQKFHLLSTLTAQENIAWPLLLDGRARKPSLERAANLLNKVGLSGRADHYPSQLSGGEQQRIAIARALVASPKIVFADEPTGALDSKTGASILDLLKRSVLAEGGSLVMVTHDAKAAEYCDRTVRLSDGLQC